MTAPIWLMQAGFDGVHVDAGDVTPAEARRLLGPGPNHRHLWRQRFAPARHPRTSRRITSPSVRYFETRTKQTDKTPIGIEGVRKLREQAGPRRRSECRRRNHARDRAGCARRRRDHGRRSRGDLSHHRSRGGVSTLDRPARLNLRTQLRDRRASQKLRETIRFKFR